MTKHIRRYVKDDEGKTHTIDGYGSMSEAIKNKSNGHCYMCKLYLPIMCLTKCKCDKWWFRLKTDLPVILLSESQAKEVYEEMEKLDWKIPKDWMPKDDH